MREIAWTAAGKWVGDGRSRRAPRLAAPHQGCIKKRCGRFVCAKCKRCMPWCWGSADEGKYGYWCDDCWAADQ